METPEFSVDPFDAKYLAYKIIAGNKVVWVNRGLDKQAIIMRGKDTAFRIHVFVAQLDGEWKIVR